MGLPYHQSPVVGLWFHPGGEGEERLPAFLFPHSQLHVVEALFGAGTNKKTTPYPSFHVYGRGSMLGEASLEDHMLTASPRFCL